MRGKFRHWEGTIGFECSSHSQIYVFNFDPVKHL